MGIVSILLIRAGHRFHSINQSWASWHRFPFHQLELGVVFHSINQSWASFSILSIRTGGRFPFNQLELGVVFHSTNQSWASLFNRSIRAGHRFSIDHLELGIIFNQTNQSWASFFNQLIIAELDIIFLQFFLNQGSQHRYTRIQIAHVVFTIPEGYS